MLTPEKFPLAAYYAAYSLAPPIFFPLSFIMACPRILHPFQTMAAFLICIALSRN